MIGSGTLFDGLYKLNLDNLYAETLMTLHHSVGTKRHFCLSILELELGGTLERWYFGDQ